MLPRIALVITLALVPSLLSAQAGNPTCSTATLNDACQKTADIFGLLAPQFAALAAAGNPTPGQVGPIGGLGHLSLGLKVTGMRMDVPDTRQLTLQEGDASPEVIETQARWVTLPVLDASVGVFRGFPVGMTLVGGLDLLLTGSWLPAFSDDGMKVSLPDGSFRVGVGARLGLLRETVRIPALDLTMSRNQLPTARISNHTNAGDTLTISDARVRSNSWRLIAGKSYRPFALAAGFGQDRYRSSAAVMSSRSEAGGARVETGPTALEQRLTRSNVFANLALNAAPMRLVGEVGRSWGGSLETFNEFQDARADAPRFYGSLAIRIGF